jgi:transposase
MIVIGVDVHKQSVTAVATDEVGRVVDERTVASGGEELLDWAGTLGDERLWAVEDCRRLTRWLERQLLAAGLRMLARSPHLERVARWLARQDQDLQVRLARELISSCRRLNREIAELEHELEERTAALAPALLDLRGCGAITAAKLLAEIGPIGRFQTDAQLARHTGVAPLEASSGPIQRHRLDRGGNRQLNAEEIRRIIECADRA